MNGNVLYEVARQRIAEQQRAAQVAGEARQRRGFARARRARKEARETFAAPVIPDFAHEMFGAAGGAVPAPREESGRDRDARSSR